MKIAALVLVLAQVFAAAPAAACSLVTASKFVPDERQYVAHHAGDAPQRLPRPTVSLEYVRGGTLEPGSSCEDAGMLAVSVSLPKASPFSLDELGFYFRVVAGSDPYAIIPPVPAGRKR